VDWASLLPAVLAIASRSVVNVFVLSIVVVGCLEVELVVNGTKGSE
jgi:hypothetical protein